MTINAPHDNDSILVLDDEPRVIAAIDDVLEDYHRVIEEASAGGRLERVPSTDAAATTLRDRGMPDASGDEFLKKVMELTEATRVLLAGYAEMHSVVRAVDQADIYGHREKPRPDHALLGTLKGAVEACALYRAVLKERALFDDLMRSIPDGAFIKDKDGRFMHLNSTEGRILGVGAASEAIGKTLHDLVAPDIAELWGADEWNVLGGHRRARSSVREVSRSDGSMRYYAVNLAARRNCEGEVTGLLGLSRDVTEERHVEHMKEAFVATVSHELRTPLTSILGSLSALSAGLAGDLPEPVRQMIDMCRRNGDRLLDLVNDVLDLEKIKQGRLSICIAPVAVQGLVEEAVAVNEGYGRPEGKTIQLAGPVPAVHINGDRGRLLQVLSNLLSNALKFSPPGAKIRLRATMTAGTVRIAVTDLGGGIPPEFASRIFLSFSQADPGASRLNGGTGLGLWISRAIMDAHDGTIAYRSRYNWGSKFYIELPVLP